MDDLRAMLSRQARQPTPKDRDTGLPTTYVEGLTASEKEKQVKAIKKSQREYRKTGTVMERPGTPSGTRSPHVVKFEKTFGFPVTDLSKVRKEFPNTDVNTILKKGAAAYASGSRPGQSISSWKFSRLASVLTAGKALAVDKDEVGDADLKKIIRRK
jgi:hypothetical protein